ncbi:intron Large complex component GCFC2 isoform X2 [Ascaphus truei]|uniref:intron Large complex component GCFC2 isoform X2 n=1 Tax=Ascaphus truei TaxID=8439 RepID=UPI003F59914B
MFRKPKRSLRVRRAESSEEEEAEAAGHAGGARSGQRRPEGRGLSCRTETREKRREEAGAQAGRRGERPRSDDDEQQESDEGESCEAGLGDYTGPEPPAESGKLFRGPGGPSLLSFREEKEGVEESFKIRKPSVNAVVFKVKKAESEDGANKPEGNCKDCSESESSSSSSSNESECKRHEDGRSSESEESQSSAASRPSPPPHDTLSAGEIPDGKSIRAARKQRKLARAHGDYIALHASHEASNSSQSESGDELDDHEKRIKFAPRLRTLREQMADETLSNSDAGSGGNQEDEDLQDTWEEQQIRKAIKYPQIMDDDWLIQRRPNRIKIRKVEPRFPLPSVTVQDIRKKLAVRLASFREVHRSHEQESEKFMRDLESSKTTLEMLEKTSSERCYKFYKEMKTYVENLVDCLNEKITRISELESEMLKLLQHRARTVLQRRQADLLSESAAIQRIAGGNENKSDNKVEDEAPNALEDPECRRMRRRQAREHSVGSDHCEGMSSDDEMPADEERALQKNRDDILLECKTIFEDVHEDFYQIKNILSKFQDWREKFSESYYDAYISLCLPKLLNPLIRLQLLDWNPLENVRDLGQMAWYLDIEEFCCSKDNSETNLEDNPDHKVLSAVIEKTLLPKLSGFVEHVWDPLSSVQTDNLVHLCKTHVLENESSKAVQGLISCLVSRLKKTIEDDVFIPIYPKSALEDKTSPKSTFQERQFWSAVKVLRNVLCWDGFLQDETLQELGLDKLLNRYLLLILLNAQPGPQSVKKCSKLVECLPQSWFRGLQSGSSLPRLANFSKHMLQCVHALHKMNERANMEVLVSLLVKIKALDYAEEVIKQYHMEELEVLVNF